MEAGKLELNLRPFNLREALAATLRALMPTAQAKGLDLLVRIAPDVPKSIIGDPDRLHQVLVNLFGNAVKFTARGEISVAVEVDAQEPGRVDLRFSVEDTGIGIAEADHARIFLPFSQVDSSTTRQYGGTGLGLSICADLVRLMGGRLWLKSEAGVGSVFYFTVKAERSAPLSEHAVTPGTADEQPGERTNPAQALRVLLAEDQRINQMLAVAILGAQGHTVTLAQTGLEAVEQFKQGEFDVILMDIQMPEMDGYAAAKVIRELEQARGTGQRIRIIAVTANAYASDRNLSLAAGMDEHVGKPYRKEELLAAIEGRALAATPEDTVPPAGN